jgi:hypothetical protein
MPTSKQRRIREKRERWEKYFEAGAGFKFPNVGGRNLVTSFSL